MSEIITRGRACTLENYSVFPALSAPLMQDVLPPNLASGIIIYFIPRQVHIDLPEAMPVKINNLHPRTVAPGHHNEHLWSLLSEYVPFTGPVTGIHGHSLCFHLHTNIISNTTRNRWLVSTCACSLTSVLFSFSLFLHVLEHKHPSPHLQNPLPGTSSHKGYI